MNKDITGGPRTGWFSKKAVRNVVREKLSILGRNRPPIRVLMHPAAEQNPYLVVTRRALEDLGAKVTMLHDLESGELLRQAPMHDILHIFNIKEYRSPFSHEESIGQLSGFSRRFGNLWAAKRLGLKIFWTLYNEPKGGYSSEWLERTGRKMMFHQADRIVCLSRATGRLFRERYPDLPEKKILHIPHHNFGDYYPSVVSRRQGLNHLGIQPKGRIYLCYGGIHPYKGLADIIPIFGRHPMKDHTLIIAGNPTNKHYAKNIEGLCSRYDNIHTFLRYITPDEVQYYMQSADFFVMPYKNIVNSGSLMLALAFGKPLVAPNVGSIPEVATPQCSMLFDQAGSQELKSALARSLEMNLDKARAEARRLSQTYSAELLTRKLANAYLDFYPKRDKIQEELEEL